MIGLILFKSLNFKIWNSIWTHEYHRNRLGYRVGELPLWISISNINRILNLYYFLKFKSNGMPIWKFIFALENFFISLTSMTVCLLRFCRIYHYHKCQSKTKQNSKRGSELHNFMSSELLINRHNICSSLFHGAMFFGLLYFKSYSFSWAPLTNMIEFYEQKGRATGKIFREVENLSID